MAATGPRIGTCACPTPLIHWGNDMRHKHLVAAAATAGLARYKQPRVCLTIEKLPRSLQGKIQRARVRDMVLARYRMIDGPYPAFEEKPS